MGWIINWTIYQGTKLSPCMDRLLPRPVRDVAKPPTWQSFANSCKTDVKAPKESKPIPCEHCGKALVKPSTVLFGRNLPVEFFQRAQEDLPTLDLLIVAGTSLVVSPANSLVYQAPETTCRVIVNREPVGQELGIEYDDDDDDYSLPNGDTTGDIRTSSSGRDFFAQGDCDSVFLDLIQELGWLEELWEKRHDLPPQSADLLHNVKQAADTGTA
jgi:hypothetical protein